MSTSVEPTSSVAGVGHDHSHWITDPTERARLGHRAQVLAAASVTYNLVEAIIAIAAGMVAGSIALVGFGLDSVVEVSSGLIILWQFRYHLPEFLRARRVTQCGSPSTPTGTIARVTEK